MLLPLYRVPAGQKAIYLDLLFLFFSVFFRLLGEILLHFSLLSKRVSSWTESNLYVFCCCLDFSVKATLHQNLPFKICGIWLTIYYYPSFLWCFHRRVFISSDRSSLRDDALHTAAPTFSDAPRHYITTCEHQCH